MLLLLPGGAVAQAADSDGPRLPPPLAAGCPEGEVTRIFIDNHSVFDPASVPPDPRIRWAYRLANRIHVRTRRDFIEDELLLSVGDCYDPVLSRESARILREFRFIASADAFSVPQEDGSRHMVVETRDEWTTKLAGDVGFDDGVRLRGVSIIEENFLGRGISLGAYFMEEDERRDVGGLFGIPRVGGSNWDLATAAGRTRVGSSWSQTVVHPFVGEVGTFAFRQRAHAREDLFTWHLPNGLPWSHLVAPLDVGGLEVTGARRFGTTGRFLLVGGGLSREWVRPGLQAEIEGVRAGAFADREPVPDSISTPMLGQLQNREATRLNLLLGVRRVRYVERSGLDALAGVQDVPSGRELLLSMGPSVGGGEGPGDVFVRGDAFTGFATESVVGQLHVTLEGRRERGSPDTPVRDLLGEFHAFLYHQVPTAIPQTLVLRVSGQGGWRTDAPFQLMLGGPDGVRGYPDAAFPGGRRLVVTVEDRFRLPSPLPDLADLGATLFADLGRIHRGDAPWADPSGWRGTVGAGLRVGFPAGSSSVVRLDVAFPLGPGSDGQPRLILQAREWVGILDTFRSQELMRSRRSGVSSQFTGVNRVPASR
ncbi:MAG: hypothetical protein EA350_12545 [Gemmatimonadales bacterium]|nr:MAG: hypothetical protein EA350_12545 [Gemmatimonadales bacterium]